MFNGAWAEHRQQFRPANPLCVPWTTTASIQTEPVQESSMSMELQRAPAERETAGPTDRSLKDQELWPDYWPTRPGASVAAGPSATQSASKPMYGQTRCALRGIAWQKVRSAGRAHGIRVAQSRDCYPGQKTAGRVRKN